MAAIAAVALGSATAKGQFIPPWLMGGQPGHPVIGVPVPPGGHPWMGPTVPGNWSILAPFVPKVGCYFTRVRTNNTWQRAQICDYL